MRSGLIPIFISRDWKYVHRSWNMFGSWYKCLQQTFSLIPTPYLSNVHPSTLVHDGGDEVHVHLPGVKDPPPLLIVALLACTLARASCSLHTALQTTCCTAAGARVARTRAGAPTLLTTAEDGEVGVGFCTVYLGYAMWPQYGDSGFGVHRLHTIRPTILGISRSFWIWIAFFGVSVDVFWYNL